MASKRVRYILLCEDKMQERFMRLVCGALGWEGIRIKRAPKSEGSALKYILENYLAEVRAFRARSHQENRVLLVMLDGDQVGLKQRKSELAGKLGEPKLRSKEKIAIEVPTWSIETWLGCLNGEQEIDETTKYKKATWLPQGSTPKDSKELASYLKRAAERFVEMIRGSSQPETLPSLDDGIQELKRLLLARGTS